MGKLAMKENSLAIITLIILTSLNLSSCKPAIEKDVSFPEQELTKSSDPKLVGIDKDKITIGDGKKVSARRISANYKTYDSDNELFQSADLVVIGKPTVNIDETSYISLSESESRSRKYPDNVSVAVKTSSGLIVSANSTVLFKVQRYLKGDLKEKQIRVVQSSAYIQEPGQEPFVLLKDGGTPFQKKSRYVLFLKEVDTATYPNLTGVYSIMSVNQGKFNLDKTDSQESEVEGSDEQYRKLKEKVKKRHESDFNSTPDT
jgi:hypothetical protein